MQTLTIPSTSIVTALDSARFRRESVTGWLVMNDRRLLTPTFEFRCEDVRPIVADLLETRVARRIGAAIVGPRELRIADRLAIAEFVFRDTKRRVSEQYMVVWLAQPSGIDWSMQLYYAAWYAFLTSHSLTGWLAWQEQGIVPSSALRRMRERLLQDSVGVLTRLELVEMLKHLDTLAAEW